MERWVGLVWLKHSGQFTYKAVNHRSRDQHHHHWAMPQNTYNESESTEYVGLRDSTVALKQLAEGFARCPVTNIPDKYLRRPEPKKVIIKKHDSPETRSKLQFSSENRPISDLFNSHIQSYMQMISISFNFSYVIHSMLLISVVIVRLLFIFNIIT